jgi:hypothetical protein
VNVNQPDNLKNIPGVGKKLSERLRDIGIRKVSDLKNKDPEMMYRKLEKIKGLHIDRCVLYVFRTAVYYANNKTHNPELLKWWNWKDKKLQSQFK